MCVAEGAGIRRRNYRAYNPVGQLPVCYHPVEMGWAREYTRTTPFGMTEDRHFKLVPCS